MLSLSSSCWRISLCFICPRLSHSFKERGVYLVKVVTQKPRTEEISDSSHPFKSSSIKCFRLLLVHVCILQCLRNLFLKGDCVHSLCCVFSIKGDGFTIIIPTAILTKLLTHSKFLCGIHCIQSRFCEKCPEYCVHV